MPGDSASYEMKFLLLLSSPFSVETNSPRLASNKPNHSWDGDGEGQNWFTERALSYGAKTIYVDAWSAPS